MNRRRMLPLLSGLLLFPVAGCEQMSFLPQSRKAQTVGFEAVTRGMNERQVRRLLGEPARRMTIKLEGGDQTATNLTYVGGGKLANVTLVRGAVIDKQQY